MKFFPPKRNTSKPLLYARLNKYNTKIYIGIYVFFTILFYKEKWYIFRIQSAARYIFINYYIIKYV